MNTMGEHVHRRMRSDPEDAGAKACGVRHCAIAKPPKGGIGHLVAGRVLSPHLVAEHLFPGSCGRRAFSWASCVWVAREASDLG